MPQLDDPERCRAYTRDDERCERTAGDGDYCYQHDSDDPTVGTDGPTGEQRPDASTAGEGPLGGADSVVDVRRAVVATAEGLVGNECDSVIEVMNTGDGWLATIEVVERHAVPDTQDILGRYEITLDDTRSVTGYERIGRYRRSDTDPFE
ncbi:gas vesicle protein GvpO, halophile-type [Haloarchaeobius amylolyticus]|uniref:gas vesicle protein GvpO, halophile-type n=1 Tax=Haloarchaeobius amylolyticus TaxID=1198296 RepID=UPI0022713A27|nr:gas vesicle protein GvpO [Haloarchaeobius amylolyticus]